MTPPKVNVAIVRAIAGEPTTFEVASKSEPGKYHRVCVKAHDGAGQCTCVRWERVGWPRIRDTGTLPPSMRCRHLKAARELYTNKKIAEERVYE